MEVPKTLNFLSVFVFAFICGTIIFPAFAFMNTNSIHYIQYIPIISLFVFTIMVFWKLSQGDRILFDFIFAYLIYYFISNVIIHGPPKYSYDFLFPILLLTTYGLYKNYRNSKIIRTILLIYLIVCVIESFIGMSQVLFGVPKFEHLALELEEDDRNYFAFFLASFSRNTTMATGTFLHFNSLGSALVIGIPIAYALFIKEKKVIYLIATFIIFMGIIFTFSRGSLIGAMIALSILYFSFTRGKYMKIYIAILIMFIGALIFTNIIVSYAEETGHASPRFDTWSYSFEYALKQPINLFFGYGLSFFKSEVLAHKTTVLSNIHNAFLMIFLEQGIVGSILFLFGSIHVFKKAFVRKAEVNAYLLVAIMAGFYFTQIFDHAFFGTNGLILFIMIALLQDPLIDEKESKIKISRLRQAPSYVS